MMSRFRAPQNSSYMTRPVIWELAKAVGCIVAGFAAVVGGSIAMRLQWIPDTYAGAILAFGPGLALCVWGFYFLLGTQTKAIFGESKPFPDRDR